MISEKWSKRGIVFAVCLIIFLLMAQIGMGTDEKDAGVKKELADLVDEPQVTGTDNDTLDLKNAMQIHFIDVGQGKSILIKKGNEGILIDGGDTEYGDFLVAYLRQAQIDKLAYVIATHPHSDHMGGLVKVLASIEVGEVLVPDEVNTTFVYENFMNAIIEKNISLRVPEVGDEINFFESRLRCLSPVKAYEDINNMSLVFRLDKGAHSFLFTGDIESMVEDDLLLTGEDLEVMVLDAPHHGSHSSNQAAFLDAVKPEIVVFSVGKDNAYKHPHEEVLNRYKKRDIQTLRTDMEGSIVFITDGITMRCKGGSSE